MYEPDIVALGVANSAGGLAAVPDISSQIEGVVVGVALETAKRIADVEQTMVIERGVLFVAG